MSLMFFADDAEVPLPPREVRILEAVARPSPDGYRVALNLTLTPFLEYPNLEVVLYRPDGAEERSLMILGTMERNLLVTLHVKQPVPDGTYRAHIELVYEGEVLQTRDVVFSMPGAIG
jgi:hypothetical protein